MKDDAIAALLVLAAWLAMYGLVAFATDVAGIWQITCDA